MRGSKNSIQMITPIVSTIATLLVVSSNTLAGAPAPFQLPEHSPALKEDVIYNRPPIDPKDPLARHTVQLMMEGVHFSDFSRTKVESTYVIGWCSGSLLTRHHVLTAGHCLVTSLKRLHEHFTKPTGPLTIRTYVIFPIDGDLFSKNASGSKVRAAIANPVYESDGWIDGLKKTIYGQSAYDLAVLRLATPAPKNLEPVTIGSTSSLKPGQPLVVTGTGKATPSGPMSSVVRKLETSVEAVEPLTYRTLAPKDANICEGDSGSPEFALRNDGSYVQVGIAASSLIGKTLGRLCEDTGINYSVRLDQYLDFLRETVASTSKDLPVSEVELKIED